MNPIRLSLLILILFFSTLGFSQDKKAELVTGKIEKVESKHLKNLYRLNKAIYRSDQPNKYAFKELKDLGVKSVLAFRSSHVDKKLAKGLDFDLHFMAMKADQITQKQVLKALKIIQESPKPILVHCYHGSDRTGAIIASYRVVVDGWTKEAAIDELMNGGFGYHEGYTNIPVLIKELDVTMLREALGIKITIE